MNYNNKRKREIIEDEKQIKDIVNKQYKFEMEYYIKKIKLFNSMLESLIKNDKVIILTGILNTMDYYQIELIKKLKYDENYFNLAIKYNNVDILLLFIKKKLNPSKWLLYKSIINDCRECFIVIINTYSDQNYIEHVIELAARHDSVRIMEYAIKLFSNKIREKLPNIIEIIELMRSEKCNKFINENLDYINSLY